MAKVPVQPQKVAEFKTGFPWVQSVISAVILGFLIWDLGNLPSKLGTPQILLIGLAILPWAGQFLASFKLSATGLEAEFQELKKEIETVVEAQSEPEITGDPTNASDVVDLTDEDTRVLQALTHSKYTLRSWSGVKNDAELSGKAQTTVILEDLVQKGLARKSIGKRTGNELWSITPDGYRAMISQTASQT